MRQTDRRAPVLLALLGAAAIGARVPGQPHAVPAPTGPATPASVAAAAPPPPGLRDRAELEAFMDGVIAAQKESNHVEGVTVAVVANGQLLFAKGYGYADRQAWKKVDPERTMFRVGSVSKLFTWTAVMQLVEQGKLDLNADVNRYLAGSPVHVPEAFGRPVTMASLMTHTPGFEDPVVGLFSRSPEAMRPLGTVLAQEMPDRVRPPGTLSSYSNHGTALAGFVVERVAGIPFERYVEERILQPLSMSHTTVRQPVPAALAADTSVGYKYGGGQFEAQTFEYVPAAPAGGVSASAVDMSHFMLAHLQDGRYGDGRILSEATSREMHSRLFGHVPALNGMLHGFYEMSANGRRMYGHGGDTIWFHTQLALLPDDGVGLFASYNSDSGSGPRSALIRAFVDHYFPAAEPVRPWRPAPASTTRALNEPAGTFAGRYRSIRMSYRSLAKMAALMQTVVVSELPDGRLLTSGLRGEPTRWVETRPCVFRNSEGNERIAFLKDAQGRVTHVVTDFPAVAFERVGILEWPTVHYALFAGTAAVLLSALIVWPVGAWRHRQRWGDDSPPRWGRLVMWFAALLLLGCLASLALVLRDPTAIVFGLPRSLQFALAFPLAAAALTLVSIVFAIRAWTKRYWRVRNRIAYTLVVLASVVLLVVLNYWRLLGYHLQ
jgi:CubicO group peptidase (beta-lactamase class C family)